MIHYFGTGYMISMVTSEEFLTEEQASQATLIVESEEVPEVREGFKARRFIDPDTIEFSWVYEEIVGTTYDAKTIKALFDKGILTDEQLKLL